MSFYVSAIKYERKALVCGPFRNHGAALAKVESARKVARDLFHDVDHFSTAWGTCQHKTGHPTTKAIRAVNEALGLGYDAQGYACPDGGPFLEWRAS